MTTGPTARPPGGNPRLKRKLLARAVDDNLRAIRNEPAGKLHRRAPVSWSFVGAAVALVAAGAALWLTLGGPLDELTAPPPVRVATPRPAAPPPPGEPARLSSEVFPVAVRRIVVDPGHGGGDHGTRTPNGLTEKELTLDIARRLGAKLREAGYEVDSTREGDARVSLRDRARLANERGADLFVSIHVNWLEDGRANRGIETYFLGPSDDPFVVRLARAENQESGYALADVRKLLESIYADLRQEQSRNLAREVQRHLVRSLREVAPEVADRGVKSAPFLVLVTTQMPAILAEVASLSNDEEARLLAQESHRERIAVALFQGIRSYSDLVASTATRTEAR
jgi:N-acetylmuramoyl-L-alanine amidase